MTNAAEDTPLGTVINMESYRTSSVEAAEGQISPRIASGLASTATAPCDTKGRSGALSDDERIRLARIRKDRRLGWMQSFSDVDFLLDLLERIVR